MSTVSIAVPTFRRPQELTRCLESIMAALTQPLPHPWSVAEVLVIDNDPEGSARTTVERIRGTIEPAVLQSGRLRYCHEHRSGISWARNRALDEARGGVLVFIDDDEVAETGWPHGILSVMKETGAAMVGGPVLTRFTAEPPSWIVRGRFFDRDDPPTGFRPRWLRTGNLAVDLHQIRAVDLRFDPAYRHGEDVAFSMEAATRSLELCWSSDGAVTEFVGPERFSGRWRTNRSRLSHRAWVSARLGIDPSPRTVGELAARGVQMFLTGSLRLLVGAATGRRHVAISGASEAAGSIGRAEALGAHLRFRLGHRPAGTGTRPPP